jgi:hypothetical protein
MSMQRQRGANVVHPDSGTRAMQMQRKTNADQQCVGESGISVDFVRFSAVQRLRTLIIHLGRGKFGAVKDSGSIT